ncbi:pirin family protein [Hyalangium sp.]|uniref:pirin family protein n=1 Tax=Hyalangium sp. TaxID=2028555 RepID=UPI002D418427|nr:pirin family protein [Hyalangium sp.]HYI02298.1 pirin family protein [Hyalangium sp.]
MSRRDALKVIAAAGASATTGCTRVSEKREEAVVSQKAAQAPDAILGVNALGFPWRPPNPFLFCAHHDDSYPAGNERMEPAASLAGRNLGQDFEGKDGWRMYHGMTIPGFPSHPHRGFETITVVRRGLLDHFDSLGATGRFGDGDVQWLTAGGGILHAEMFPMLKRESPNPLELFQIWLNLPLEDKFAPPHFSMLWRDSIPRLVMRDEAGRTTQVTVIAGRLGEQKVPAPPPKSWASRPDTDVAIWTITLSPGARWTLPAAMRGSNRSLYFFRGSGLRVAGRAISPSHEIQLRPEAEVLLEGGPDETDLLLLQGRPINEPIVQYGPFVMNSREEIRQAYADFQQTRFGGWPWPSDDPTHPREAGRFARHADGRTERPA